MARGADNGRHSIFQEVLVKFGAFLGLAILLMIVWVVSFVVFHVAGFLIHLLLVVALIFLVIQLVSGRKP